jgi:hypothetical protein
MTLEEAFEEWWNEHALWVTPKELAWLAFEGGSDWQRFQQNTFECPCEKGLVEECLEHGQGREE